MPFLRYAVPALAVASSAAAQLGSTTASCSAATTTIQSGGDAAALASCTTFTGSIAIATGTVNNIALDGIQEIQGSLIANNVTQLSQLSAGSLTTITDGFNLNGLTTLVALTFPVLSDVGSIDWEALPNLQGLAFSDGVQKVETLNIQNTKLMSLDGIDLQMASSITVVNNPFLTSISMQLGNVSQSLTFSANGQNLDVELPNLEWANNMTLINCSSVDIPSLASINGSLGFYSDYFQNISAPNLTTVGGQLSITNNANLANISMPELTTTGGLIITSNSALQSIDGFPNLKTVDGAVLITGSYSNVSLPALSQVRGAFNLTSSMNITSACAHFKPLSGTPSSPIEGKFTCPTPSAGSSTGGNPSQTSGSGGSSSPSSTKNAASPLLVPGVTGVLGVVAAIFGLL